jgi:hypothetical protein
MHRLFKDSLVLIRSKADVEVAGHLSLVCNNGQQTWNAKTMETNKQNIVKETIRIVCWIISNVLTFRGAANLKVACSME